MANTTISLTQEDGLIAPNSFEVPVVQGDTIDFVAPSDSPAVLSLSPDAIAALSPSPASPLQLSASERVSFTFSTSSPGAYSILFSQQAGPDPQLPAPSTTLFLQILGAEASPPPMAVAGGRTRDAQG